MMVYLVNFQKRSKEKALKHKKLNELNDHLQL